MSGVGVKGEGDYRGKDDPPPHLSLCSHRVDSGV